VLVDRASASAAAGAERIFTLDNLPALMGGSPIV
jgi:hypothetical protein